MLSNYLIFLNFFKPFLLIPIQIHLKVVPFALILLYLLKNELSLMHHDNAELSR